jgi:hypothetical protein
LGNYVQFAHSASGDGIDMSVNARQLGSSTLYTYQAYPNATDAFGNLAACYEEFRFSKIDVNRWRCIKLPEDFCGENSNGYYEIAAIGRARAIGPVITANAVSFATSFNGFFRNSGNTGGTWTYPFKFVGAPFVESISGTMPVIQNGVTTETTSYSGYVVGATGNYNISSRHRATGRWKPNV